MQSVINGGARETALAVMPRSPPPSPCAMCSVFIAFTQRPTATLTTLMYGTGMVETEQGVCRRGE